MSDIYAQFDKATGRIGAYALLRDGRYAGKVVLHYPADGAGRLWAYVQAFGFTMARGYASGGGYDKGTAAVYSAAKRLDRFCRGDTNQGEEAEAAFSALCAGMKSDGGHDWKRQLEDAGFTVLAVC